ncbi:MAG: leucine-rich repeat domain-containing protein [Candidatus Thorarchaeota archaeon]
MLVQQIIILLVFSFFICSLFLRQQNQLKEFKVNQFLKLKLEGGRTNIYVNNRRFIQCMYLLLNIPVNKIEDYDNVNSIDEAAVKLDRSMERNHHKVPPETEFWGHCSNLQAWVDNQYDTRILHRNLAFPLLKALVDAGDPIAKRKFKEEIAMRYATGHPTVIRFLTQNGYLHYLTEDEFESMLIDIDFPSIEEYSRNLLPLLDDIENPESFKQIMKVTTSFVNRFRFKYKYLIILKAVEKIPDSKRKKFVEFIYKRYKSNSSFPVLKFLDKAQINFSNLDLRIISYKNQIIGIISNNELNLKNKMIEKVEDIKGLEEISGKIEFLDLSNNRLRKIRGFDKFTNLKKLILKNNYIERIEGLDNLKNLQLLDLSGNINIQEIPDILGTLPHLKTVKLAGCRISGFSDSVSQFFWMGQNFRYYPDYSPEEINLYEANHASRASINGRLYKNFVKWLFKLRETMKIFGFTSDDIIEYQKKTELNALHSVKPTKAFLHYLDDKKQRRISEFF